MLYTTNNEAGAYPSPKSTVWNTTGLGQRGNERSQLALD